MNFTYEEPRGVDKWMISAEGIIFENGHVAFCWWSGGDGIEIFTNFKDFLKEKLNRIGARVVFVDGDILDKYEPENEYWEYRNKLAEMASKEIMRAKEKLK